MTRRAEPDACRGGPNLKRHEAMAGRDDGASDEVNPLRLDHAARRLSDLGQRQRRFGDIARSVGFDDPAYFHYLFRRFGRMPRDFRPKRRRLRQTPA